MRIFLTGFMGCGKTTLGTRLAQKLNQPFIDLDHVIEGQTGMRIAEYFSRHGEAHFRALEARVLRTMDFAEDAIISTGGGLPCFSGNMDWMNAHGRTVYIRLTPKALFSRLEKAKSERPLLQEKQGDALVAFIEEKLTEREPYYLQANLITNGIGLTADKLVRLLKPLL